MARYKFDAKTGKLLVLDDKTGRWKPDRSRKNASRIVAPSVMSDIREFVAHAGDKPVLISSRSKRAAYERSNNIRQCGDFKPGEIIGKRKKKVTDEIVKHGASTSVNWTDF